MDSLRVACRVVIATLLVAVSVPLSAASYRFVNVSNELGQGRSLYAGAINNSGTIAFVASGTAEEYYLFKRFMLAVAERLTSATAQPARPLLGRSGRLISTTKA